MKFLTDERLYRDAAHALALLRGLDAGPAGDTGKPTTIERFHFYWYGDFTRKQALAVKSFLVTQNLNQSELWLWLDAEKGYDGHAKNPLLRPLLPFIKVLRYDPKAEAAGTPVAKCTNLYRPKKLALRSDCFRFVTLYKHGGTYVDIDTMLLRDLSLVTRNFAQEYCGRWSAHMPYGNSAMLRLLQGSETALALLQRCVERNSCHPKDSLLFADQPKLDLTILPCPFFDPFWPHADGIEPLPGAPLTCFEDFFRPFKADFRRDEAIQSYRDFFPGALAYHWHNQWSTPVVDDSYCGLFDREFDRILEKKLGIEVADWKMQARRAG